MKVYTVKDLETFERDDYGRLICPSGDYTQIKSFGNGCIFGTDCYFGKWCHFGDGCIFGNDCHFGEWCHFGNDCHFGEWCYFGTDCYFGEWCHFGNECDFGNGCYFGNECIFGNDCHFGEKVKFDNISENVDRILKIDRIGSRNGCTYFFKTLSDIYVRCGCFFGTIAEFENKVKETHKNNPQYLLEYTEAIRYAKLVLSNGGAKGKC